MKDLLNGFLSLLGSPRFIAIVLFGLAGYLDMYGFKLDPHGLAIFLQVVAGGAGAVKMVDKTVEKLAKKK